MTGQDRRDTVRNPPVDRHSQSNEARFSVLSDDDAGYYRWQAAKVALITSVLHALSCRGTLADVGCFTGVATEQFSRAGFDRAVGFDVSRKALAQAASRGIEPRVWSIGQGPCPAADGEFSCVVAADIIEHIVDTDAFLEELHRILAPGGLLLVTTPNLGFWLSRLRLLLGKPPWSYPGASSTVRENVMVDLNHIRVTTVREWSALFRARGFRVKEVKGWTIFGGFGNTLGVRLKRAVNRVATRVPALAFGLLFVLEQIPRTLSDAEAATARIPARTC